MARSISILSGEDLSETAKIHLYPLIIEIIAILNPVFPDVVSTIMLPGLSIPFSSAREMMCNAIRSFRSEEHTSELQSRENLVCRLLLEKKKTAQQTSV